MAPFKERRQPAPLDAPLSDSTVIQFSFLTWSLSTGITSGPMSSGFTSSMPAPRDFSFSVSVFMAMNFRRAGPFDM